VVVVLAASAAIAYLVAFHPAQPHQTAQLPTRVLSSQTVGLVMAAAQPGAASNELLQLGYQNGSPKFSPLPPAQQAVSSPQWTADQMAGATYILIYLRTGQCLTATGSASQPQLVLRHCDLGGDQRWRRTQAPVLTRAHDFYQYANLGDSDCLTQGAMRPAQIFGAGLSACATPPQARQLVAFW